MNARDYQQKAVDTLFDQYEAGSRGSLIVSPTGSGKTIMAGLAADRWLQGGENRRVIIIAHERQLVWQLAKSMEDTGFDVGIEMGTERLKHTEMPDIVVACRASLQPRKVKDEEGNVVPGSSRLWKYPFRYEYLVIIDECHRWKFGLKSCAHIFKHFENNEKNFRVGLTATPMRGDEVSLRDVFPDVALDYRLYDLGHGPNAVEDGWAVRYDQRFINVEGVDFTNLKEIRGDFDAHELETILAERKQLLSLVRPTLDLVGDRQTILFSPTVAMANAVSACICGERGDRDVARSLDGSVPDASREETYRDHQRGAFQFLSVCGLCREGYDDPNIQAVAIYRPTKSLGLAEQMKGRGCRPLKGIVDGLDTPAERLAAIAASDKKSCLIVDLVGVTGLGPAKTTAHLLLEGKDDEIAERAMLLALGCDDECDMVEMVEKAEEEIEAERLEAEKKRLAAEEQIAAELRADKARRIEANVRYNERRVEQGHGEVNDVGEARTTARMLVGKYKGKRLCDPAIPDDYLTWCENTFDRMPAWWMGALRKEMRYRALKPPKEDYYMSREDQANMDHINSMFTEG